MLSVCVCVIYVLYIGGKAYFFSIWVVPSRKICMSVHQMSAHSLMQIPYVLYFFTPFFFLLPFPTHFLFFVVDVSYFLPFYFTVLTCPLFQKLPNLARVCICECLLHEACARVCLDRLCVITALA